TLKAVAPGLLGVVFLFTAWGLLMAALAVLLGRIVDPGAVLLLLAAGNLTVGAFLVRRSVHSLSGRRWKLEATGTELEKTLATARSPERVVQVGTSGSEADDERRVREAAQGPGRDQGRDRAGAP
ncbi:MAG: hypothetical protein ACK4N5_21360, partial [Myxococcales bacterium]